MGGIDWAGIPLLVDVLGIEDVEMLVEHLAAIRDHQKEQADNTP